MVAEAGFEPASPRATDFKSVVYTSSTIQPKGWVGPPRNSEGTYPTHQSGAFLSSAYSRNLCKTSPVEGQEESVTTSTKSVFCGLENSTTSKVNIVLLNRKLHHGINHVLKLVCTGHFTGLVHLTDDHCVAEVLLAVVSHEAEGTLSRGSVNRTVLVLTVVHALEAIDEEEERLVLIGALSS